MNQWGGESSIWRQLARAVRLQGLAPRLLLMVVALNLLLVALVNWTLVQSRERHEEEAVAQAGNLSELLEHDLAEHLRAIDHALLDCVRLVEEQQFDAKWSVPAFRRHFAQLLQQQPAIGGVRLVDRRGRVLQEVGAVVAGGTATLAGEGYFQRLRAQPGRGLEVSGLRFDTGVGPGYLYLARAVRDRDGRFDGVVAMALELEYLHRSFADLHLGRQGVVSLYDRNLQLLTRLPELPSRTDTLPLEPVPAELRAAAAAAPAAGSYRAVSLPDGVERRYAYNAVDPFPFYVSVGLASDDYLAGWRKERLQAWSMVLIFALVTPMLAWLVHRGWRRQLYTLEALAQAYRTLDAERQLNQTIVRASPFAIYTRDRQGRVTGWNPAAEKLFGWTAEEVVGKQMLSVPPEKEMETAQLRARVLGGENIIDLEVQRCRKDGSRFDLSTTLAPLHNAVGEVTGYVAIAADISARKAAERRIEFLAYRDALTGLPNRLLLEERYRLAVAHADRTQRKVALLFMDLDNFKSINDTLGHVVGDALLRETAARLAECVRETDTLSRLGGDEFLIILGELDGMGDITPVLLKIRDRLQEAIAYDEHELSTSASIGVALYPDDGREFETLLKKADIAMYRAKENGRNQYRFFDEAMNAEIVERLSFKAGLRRALKQGEFELHYQPQFELASKRIVGVEALLRWRHPEHGLIDPLRFIPVAEESELIVPIGDWVIREACRQAMVWRAAGLPPLTMAVNLSAVQFRRGDVRQIVFDALTANGLEPWLLELELTESILLQDTENVLATVRELKQLGVCLSLDDFGTGYSSLLYLKRFDIDKLKIDRGFVADLIDDADDAAIVRAIVQIARSLGLRTLAEGVEDAETLARLHQFGCDEVQGYHVAGPMPAAELAGFLAAYRMRSAVEQGG